MGIVIPHPPGASGQGAPTWEPAYCPGGHTSAPPSPTLLTPATAPRAPAAPQAAHLVVHEDVHDVVVHLLHGPALGAPWEQHELDAQQRHEDERGPHGLHVEVGLRLVRDLQLRDEHTHDVQQEEEVHLGESSTVMGISWRLNSHTQQFPDLYVSTRVLFSFKMELEVLLLISLYC